MAKALSTSQKLIWRVLLYVSVVASLIWIAAWFHFGPAGHAVESAVVIGAAVMLGQSVQRLHS